LTVRVSPSFLTIAPVMRSPSFMVIWSANPADANKKIAQMGSVIFISPDYATRRFKRKYTGTPISTIISPGTVVDAR